MKYVPETWRSAVGNNLNFYRIKGKRFYWWRTLHSPLIRTIMKYVNLTQDMRVLEAGCGSGKLSVSLGIITGAKIFLADYVLPVLLAARSNIKDVEQYYGRIEHSLIRCDIFTSPFKENSFDVVCNDGVIEHWLNKDERIEVLKSLYKIVKKDGYVAILVPNDHPLMSFWRRGKYPGLNLGVPQIEYRKEMLEDELKSAGFRDIIIDGIDPWASIAIWPNYFPLRLISFILKNLIPLPIKLRIKYGVSIIGVGRK